MNTHSKNKGNRNAETTMWECRNKSNDKTKTRTKIAQLDVPPSNCQETKDVTDVTGGYTSTVF